MDNNYILGIVAAWFAFNVFRRSSGNPTTVPGGFVIEDISEQLPKKGNGWPTRSTSDIQDITIHHTVTSETISPEAIANIHLARTDGDWRGIAYAYLIYSDGRILQTLPQTAYSYHNGYNNRKAIGVAMVGNFQANAPTQKQMDALRWLIGYLFGDLFITYLMGHREYKNTTLCPGRNIDLDGLRAETGLQKRQTALSFSFTNEPADN